MIYRAEVGIKRINIYLSQVLRASRLDEILGLGDALLQPLLAT